MIAAALRACNAGFYRFADWAKRMIASPLHLVLFLLVVTLWTGWATSRRFDPFSQLVVNTPTTVAEYLFEILVLASAIAAEEKAAEVICRLAEHMEALDDRMDRLRDELRADFAQLLLEDRRIEETLGLDPPSADIPPEQADDLPAGGQQDVGDVPVQLPVPDEPLSAESTPPVARRLVITRERPLYFQNRS